MSIDRRQAGRDAVALLTAVVGGADDRTLDDLMKNMHHPDWVVVALAGIFAAVLDELERESPGATAEWLRTTGLQVETMEMP